MSRHKKTKPRRGRPPVDAEYKRIGVNLSFEPALHAVLVRMAEETHEPMTRVAERLLWAAIHSQQAAVLPGVER